MLLFTNRSEGWKKRGRCVREKIPVNRFFLSDFEDEACRFCQGCEVKRECLEYALGNRIEEGVWGGITARERVRREYAGQRVNREVAGD